MKIDIELGKVKVRIPENKADLPVNVIVGDDGGPEPSGSFIKQLFVTSIIESISSISGHGEVVT